MRALPLAVCGVLVGWGVGFWAAPQVLAGLARSSLARVNYRQREVVAGLGLLLPIGLLVWAAPLAVAARVDPLRAARAGLLAPSGLAVVIAGLAFVVLGLVDDLLELRPGRCAKVFLPLWVVGCVIDPGGGAWSAGLAGAALAALPFDLREEGMLGDAGANALGAVVGTLLLAGPLWLVGAAAAVLVALQLASERVSFSRVIEGNRVLRAADRLGRRGA